MTKFKLISFSVFVAGLCSIIYELLISTIASYFLGDSVKQFSVIIGIYLFSMGIGAYLSKFFSDRPLSFFIKIEFVLGIIGGFSVPLIYFSFLYVSPFQLQLLCWILIFVIGLFTGMEVPLLTYVLDHLKVKDTFAKILSLDYIGGLIATLLFPFILLPYIGLFYSSLIFGLINILLGMMLLITTAEKNKKRTIVVGISLAAIMLVSVINAGSILKVWEEKIYKAPIIYNEQTPYQHIIVTKKNDDIRLFLNRIIQFSSADEHRYHEALVHPAFLMHDSPKRVLILGGGENLATREVLKHHKVQSIEVIDIDTVIFYLAKFHPEIMKINENAALDKRVSLISRDAFNYLTEYNGPYDIILSDLPDPSNESTAKLYSKQFFYFVRNNLAEGGIFVSQSNEIYLSQNVFSCIVNTIADVFPNVYPYHVYVPSFGDWGFTMASLKPLDFEKMNSIKFPTKFLTDKSTAQLFDMPKDITINKTEINTMDRPIIINYFIKDWEKWKTDLATTN